MEPSSTVLHYAQTLFEGMKAYRDEHGKVTLFRPDMNMKRMNNSARRIALPVRGYMRARTRRSTHEPRRRSTVKR
jgi:branched-subunit amino acid aminotransferase/4-amino-4-deoxychorismate lyase